ncbi:MAG: hypothetical protein R3A51_13915 [Nannocystaceae bacterium]
MGLRRPGKLGYYGRVAGTLKEMLTMRGVADVEVRECPSPPTGSIARRAEVALQTILADGGAKADSIHLVGHSTGGLDARLLAAPGLRLAGGEHEAGIGRRVRSVITVSTPHFGAPMTNLLVKVPLRSTLERLAVLGVSGRGRGFMLLSARVLEALSDLDDWLGRSDTLLEKLVDVSLAKLARRTGDPTWACLREMARDAGASIQLTRESMRLFNAAVGDRPGVRYSSLITAAPPPRRMRSIELLSPISAIKSLGFRVLYTIASLAFRGGSSAVGPTALSAASTALPFAINGRSNDGMVPCRSQAYGRVLGVVRGDHLDVVGRFSNAGGDPGADWLPCGAYFGEPHFRRAWRLIANEIAIAEQSPRRASGRAKGASYHKRRSRREVA